MVSKRRNKRYWHLCIKVFILVAIAAAITCATLGITKSVPAIGDVPSSYFSKERGFPLHYLTSINPLPPCNSGNAPSPSQTTTDLNDKSEVAPVLSLKYMCANDEGRLPGNTKLDILVVLNSKNTSGLTKEVENVSDPNSPNYGQYLTPEQANEEFGAPAVAISAVTNWAKSYGLSANKNGFDDITVSGSSSKMEIAFKTQFDSVRLQNFSPAFANVKPMYMPPSISQYVSAVLGGDSLIRAEPQHIYFSSNFETKIQYKNLIIDWLIWLALVVLIYLAARFVKKRRRAIKQQPPV